MDSSYGSWPMQPNVNQEIAWQLGSNGVPQSIGSPPISSMNASSPPSGSTASTTSYPPFLGVQDQMMHQSPHHAYQHQHIPSSYQAHLYSHAYVPDPSPTAISASSAFPSTSLPIDAATFQSMRNAYPMANPLDLIDALIPSSQQQQQVQQAQQVQALMQHQSPGAGHATQSGVYMQSHPVYTQTNHQDPYRLQSDNSLASALTFSTSSHSRAVPPPTLLTQAELHNSAGPADTSDVGAPDSATLSSTLAMQQPSKLRQSKLNFVPGLDPATQKSDASSAPAAANDTAEDGGDAIVIVDSTSEPDTPPLPPVQALPAKPSTTGKSNSPSHSGSGTVAAKNGAPAAVQKISDRAKQPLSRLSVEREPQKAAHKFVDILSDLDPSGRFARPRPTSAEDRRIIVDTLYSIVKLEAGKGYTEAGRKRFFACLMALPAARQILSTWLRSTVPPKKVTEAVPDHSRRYRDTLSPLLAILGYVEMKSAYLKDKEAGIGKAMTGVSARAVDPLARKTAAGILEKWTKVITNEDARKSTTSVPALSTSKTASSTAPATSAKRKPAEGATAADSSVKRYKTATSVATGLATIRKPQAVPAASSSTIAKPGLSFFSIGNVRKPASTGGAPNVSAATGSRKNAHQDIMSLVGKLSAGAIDRAGASQIDATPAEAQPSVKVKKRVRWKEDGELEAIKLIEPADYGQDEEEHMEGAVDELDEGLALRQSVSSMEALMEWHEPREVLVAMPESGPVDIESVEGPFQTQRKARLEEKRYQDGEEPMCPDETQLEKPGTISEMPAELNRTEIVEIPTPWVDYMDAGAGAMDMQESNQGGDGVTDINTSTETSADIGSTTRISDLLAKVGRSVQVAGDTAGSISAVSTAAAAPAPAPAPAPATVLNFDISQIQNILETAKGSGPSANAVNKALATSNVTSDGLSNLLSSLSSLNKSNGLQVDSGSSSSDGNERRRYWQDTYEVNGASSSSKQESYPGEYRPDYRYRNTSTYRPAEERYATSTSRPSTYHHGGGYDERRDHGKGSHKRRTIPCKFFAQGLCHFGDACHFLH